MGKTKAFFSIGKDQSFFFQLERPKIFFNWERPKLFFFFFFKKSLFWYSRLESDLVANSISELFAPLIGDSLCHRNGGNAPRLGAHHVASRASVGLYRMLHQELRHLCGFATAWEKCNNLSIVFLKIKSLY